MSDEMMGFTRVEDTMGSSSPGNTREHRRRAFKAGVISYQNHSLTADCTVRDTSSAGVKLQFKDDVIVPDHFTLTIPMDQSKVDCEVRWRNGNQVGAVFVGDMERDSLRARKQSLDVDFVVSKKPSILRKPI